MPELPTPDATTTASDEDLFERLTRLDACVLSDALDALELEGVVTGLRPLWEGARLAGRAVTMELSPGPAPTTGVHLGVRAIERARQGDVVVVDNAGRTGMGAWGGLLSLTASLRGISGVVVDGACRDVDEARELGFPVFGRSPVARTARARVYEVSVGEPVKLGGLRVATGDAILADTSGVVVVAAAQAARVLERAEALAEREGRMAARLRAGETPTAVLGRQYEGMLGSSDPAS